MSPERSKGSPIAHPIFEIHETHIGKWLRLRLTGELDLGSVPHLIHRLDQLRAAATPVLLDLSGLEFIDSSGIHLLIRTLKNARASSWPLEVEPGLSPQVEHSLRLAKLERLIADTRVTHQRPRPRD